MYIFILIVVVYGIQVQLLNAIQTGVCTVLTSCIAVCFACTAIPYSAKI